MTNEMHVLYAKLLTVNVKNVVGAYGYLSNEMKEMDMNGTLDFEMDYNSLKNINKEFKILKKFYKGKIEIEPKSLFMKYEENTHEHYFLKCLIELMHYNS